LVFIHPIVIDSDEVADKISRNQYEQSRVEHLKYDNGKLESTSPPPLPEFEEILPRKKANAAEANH
jgi:hypothetical protein